LNPLSAPAFSVQRVGATIYVTRETQLAGIVAYDGQTGKKLWEQYRQNMPLTLKAGSAVGTTH
jgi:hypothetical protein